MPNKIAANVLAGTAVANDPNTSGQWYFDRPFQSKMSIEVESVWEDYTGKGITVAVLDSVIRADMADLDDNYDATSDYNLSTDTDDVAWNRADLPMSHGTLVAGVIAAERGNGVGTVGVAYEASITSFAMDYTASDVAEQASQGLRLASTVDVLNASWSYSRSFDDKLKPGSEEYNALQTAVEYGRDGLGTVVVFSAGNAYATQSSNYHGYQNSPFTISVGAVGADGEAAAFSSMGANILVSAAGVDILTTDPYSNINKVSGTSFSAPIVSAAAALILEANEDLGYRDVMKIIGLSATAEDLGTDDRGGLGWVTNGADNFNGGGMHFSDSYGFGYLNVHDAVRLAETWQEQSTFENLESHATTKRYSDTTLTAGSNDHVQVELDCTDDVILESAQLQLQLAWGHSNDIEIFLTSPDGTVSQLAYDFAATNGGGGFYNFPFATNAVMGESAKGTWTIDIYNRNPDALHFSGTKPMSAALTGATLTVHGSPASDDDVYYYNDEFGSYYSAQELATRSTLSDDDGGIDTLNAAMVTTGIKVDLSGDTASQISGVTVNVDGGEIENIFSGDGNDTLVGSDDDNILRAGRGDDLLTMSGGNDTLDGGQGTDRVNLNIAFSDLKGVSHTNGTLVIGYMVGTALQRVTLENVENFVFTDGAKSLAAMIQKSVTSPLDDTTGTDDTTKEETTGEETTEETKDETTEEETTEEEQTVETVFETVNGTAQNDRLVGSQVADMISGLSGNDTLVGRNGDDWLDGGYGNDVLNGGNGADTLMGAWGNDKLSGGGGDDSLVGGGAEDTIVGADGNDLLNGEQGNDRLIAGNGDDTVLGGSGDDVLLMGNGADLAYGGGDDDLLNGGNGNDTLSGDNGNDRLIGGQGNDSLQGGGGEDILIGTAGDNILIGGQGNDTLYGGNGQDTFVFNLSDNSVDKVFRYNAHEQDSIVVQLSGDAAGSLVYTKVGGSTMLGFDDGHSVQDIALFTGTDVQSVSALTELSII